MLALVACSGSSIEGDKRVLRTANGVYSVSMLDGGLTGLYYDSGEVLGRLRPNMKRVVLLGLGGGEMLRAARRSLPRAELVGVELDPLVAKAAFDDFKVADFGVQVVVADAAAYLEREGGFDGVMVDVYDDDVIPPYFRTTTFFKACRQALNPQGLLLMNVYPADQADEVVSAVVRAGFTKVKRGVVGLNVVVLAER